MTASFTEDALWMKARLFINRAMDSEVHRSFDEQALWASLGLEVLGKAALSRVSPLLIATPDEDGSNLLIASGLVEGEATFHSVQAKTVFARCAKAFRPFSLKEAKLIAAGRNEYLHGGAPTIGPLPPHAWWPRFWAQAVILLTAQDREIEELVGTDRVSVVEEHLARNREHLAQRVEALIGRAKQRLALHEQGLMTARQEAEWAATADPSAGLGHHAEATCPACGATGLLEGREVLSYEVNYERTYEEDYDVWVNLSVGSDYFSCPRCHLVLDGYELLDAAGLDDQFPDVGSMADYPDPDDYGND
ncbi:hypothetical protein [Blastococcus sp. TF02A-30]|uniref:hypothetical protein n=1 Tax=Blastococcus sp. TF02A-30 TaxID=2250580 RepID=UPI000DEA91B9|nr:hypothetical protein [Blastococcus sp. TF02A-30]RBY86452.1 hypothetical protein DQ241_13030 [Blastococcus sp. TF02A-30]